MVVTPNSNIILIKSPLKLDNYNQITFTNATNQYNYFYNLEKLEYDNCTYQRKDGVIRYKTGDDVDLYYEDLLKYNYCMYQNTHYSNKWFYAFVTDVRYVNDGMTEITIETDVFQTWQFDIEYKSSFVEREHVSNDTVGLHTVPEGLEFGEYVIESTGDVETSLDSNKYECIGVSWTPENTPFATYNRIYGGVYSGVTYFVFKTDDDAGKFIRAYDNMGKSGDIVNIFMIPRVIADITPSSDRWFSGTLEGIQITTAVLPNQTGVVSLRNDITLSSPTTLNGYTPKNKKLLTYPYNALSITNNAGIQVEYRYEDFINNTPLFYLVGVPSPSCSVWLYPENYKKNSTSKAGYNWGLPVAKYPMGSWNSDMYTNWMTQNGVNIMGVKIDAPTSHAIGGSLTALFGGLDNTMEGLGQMFGAVQEQYRASMMPNQIGGQVNSGDVTYAYLKMSPTYYKMTIREEYARIIDDFFTMYGYKVNNVKTPQINSRLNWNYIKCINVNLDGEIPEADLEKIRSMFNVGCTFWHNPSTFLNYTASNTIV